MFLISDNGICLTFKTFCLMKKNEVFVYSILGVITVSAAVVGFVKRKFIKKKFCQAKKRLQERFSGQSAYIPEPEPDPIPDPAPAHNPVPEPDPAPEPKAGDAAQATDTNATTQDTTAQTAGEASSVQDEASGVTDASAPKTAENSADNAPKA